MDLQKWRMETLHVSTGYSLCMHTHWGRKVEEIGKDTTQCLVTCSHSLHICTMYTSVWYNTHNTMSLKKERQYTWKDLPFGGYRGNACPFGFPILLTQDVRMCAVHTLPSWANTLQQSTDIHYVLFIILFHSTLYYTYIDERLSGPFPFQFIILMKTFKLGSCYCNVLYSKHTIKKVNIIYKIRKWMFLTGETKTQNLTWNTHNLHIIFLYSLLQVPTSYRSYNCIPWEVL